MPDATDDSAERLERIESLQRAIDAHPAYLEHHAIRALGESFGGVYLPNLAELDMLLSRPTNDDEFAIELVQNTKAPTVRNAFTAALLRSLHNYLASSHSLVDHVRRVMRGRTGTTVAEFSRRRDVVAKDPAIAFFRDLRNFTLHRALPPISYEARFPDPGHAGGLECDIRLAAEGLRSWDGWRQPSRQLLSDVVQGLSLQPLVQQHASRVAELNEWLILRLGVDNASGLAEVNELIIQQEVIATGLEPAVVRRRIHERSARANYPSQE